MLTRNYWRFFSAMMARLTGVTYSVTVTLPDGTTITDGLLTTSSRPYNVLGTIAAPYSDATYGKTIPGTWYGKGTTPAALDDYTLEAPITDGSITAICGGNSNLVRAEGPDHYRFSAVHQVTNNTDEEIAISEIGCFGSITNGGKVLMLDRTVLKTPVVIPPRETVPLEYVIKFPYGT